jgi:hypothetical protein
LRSANAFKRPPDVQHERDEPVVVAVGQLALGLHPTNSSGLSSGASLGLYFDLHARNLTGTEVITFLRQPALSSSQAATRAPETLDQPFRSRCRVDEGRSGYAADNRLLASWSCPRDSFIVAVLALAGFASDRGGATLPDMRVCPPVEEDA